MVSDTGHLNHKRCIVCMSVFFSLKLAMKVEFFCISTEWKVKLKLNSFNLIKPEFFHELTAHH